MPITLKSEVEVLEGQLRRLAQKVYEKSMSTRRYQPLFPWVLVRTIDKEQQVGHIVLTDKQQRACYEGIVLATWGEADRYNKRGKLVHYVSQLQPGDRILFHYAEGYPAVDLDEKYYRFVREEVDQDNYPKMGTFAKIDYEGDAVLRQRITDAMKDLQLVTYQDTGKGNG